ncbi:MAG: DNA alkylation repair protein [Actinomycetia bacterium]|nr:DNA alkylation repair protein [Actinomycetes bacterium]
MNRAGQIIEKLKQNADPEVLKGRKRYGIDSKSQLGLQIPFLRKLAKEEGKDHDLALDLWDSGIHEARILASMVDDYNEVTESQMEDWAKDFDSWDVCDQVCNNLFKYSPYAYRKAGQWALREEEFVKRAGFALMATLAVGDKEVEDNKFIEFFKFIEKQSTDCRNYVKKAVNWALRQIGKRNIYLNRLAIETAEKISNIDSAAARWIAADALRELKSKPVAKRLGRDG